MPEGEAASRRGGAALGAIANAPVVDGMSDYGQPTGSRPTMASAAIYFVDVTFTEP